VLYESLWTTRESIVKAIMDGFTYECFNQDEVNVITDALQGERHNGVVISSRKPWYISVIQKE